MTGTAAAGARPRVPCAGGIVLRGEPGARRLLLIRRGRPPSMGAWSVPGGRCLPGESPVECCVRELREETGLHVRVTAVAGRVERDAPDGSVYLIDDFVCEVIGGELSAGDDAADAQWVSGAEFAALPLAPLLAETLGGWGLLPD